MYLSERLPHRNGSQLHAGFMSLPFLLHALCQQSNACFFNSIAAGDFCIHEKRTSSLAGMPRNDVLIQRPEQIQNIVIRSGLQSPAIRTYL